MRIFPSVCVSAITISLFCQSQAEDVYLGAEKVMEKIAKKQESEGGQENPGSEVLREIERLIQGADGLTERAAAEGWVGMAMDYFEIPAAKRSELQRMDPPFKLETILTALPPTSAWDDLAEVAAGLPDKKGKLSKDSLRLIIAVLGDSEKGRVDAMAGLREAFEGTHSGDAYELKYAETYFKQLEVLLAGKDVDADSAIAAFREKLRLIDTPSEDDPSGENYAEIPEIAGRIDEAEAKALILRAIKLKVQYSVDYGPTRRLIAKVMLENPDAIASPIWEIIETAEDMPLFVLFTEKFPKDDDWRKGSAESRYVGLLLSSLEFDKAGVFLKRKREAKEKVDIGMRDLEATRTDEGRAKMIAFFKGLLEADPTLPYWDVYLELAAEAGVSADAMEVVRKAAAGAENGTELRVDLEGHFLRGLTEAGKMDEGLAYLRGLVEVDSHAGAVTNKVGADAFMQRCFTLIRMAVLLGKDDLKEEALAAAKLAYGAVQKYSESRYLVSQYVVMLLEHGRGSEAESVVTGELMAMSDPALRANPRTDMMAALAHIYNRAGRHADVVKLLDNSDMWGVSDLAEATSTSFDSKSLLLIAAESLFAEGRAEDASRVLDRVLQRNPGEDAAYALLLKIGRPDVLAKLDGLYAMNRFEERPLIWKAQSLLDSGKLDEAEKAVQAAIAIDPSDGEQGKGDRMRAYAVLADILAKKGDAKQSEFLHGVVRAIRMSETADDWAYAGFRARAIEIYEASLKEFSDAYCIQSRLALRYSEAGDFEKAAEHYRRAFELMPESFGRVESHCFGCEGAFTGELAQGIAEKVFLKLAEEMPDRAQTSYLLGYLRQEQGRYAEAAEQYGKAVKTDPLYINAWKKLEEVADEAGLPVGRRDEITLAIYRLNPGGESLREVTDLTKLWDTVLEVDKTYRAPDSGPLFALKLAKGGRNDNQWGYSPDEHKPRMALGGNQIINGLTNLLESLHGR